MNYISKIKIFIFTIFVIKLNCQNFSSKFDSLIILQPEKMQDQNISRQEIIRWNMKMLEIAKKNNYPKGIIWANINLGVQNYNLSKPDLSLIFLNKAKDLANEISADKETYSKIYQEFSQVYFTLGVTDLSLKYNAKAIYYGRKIKDDYYKNKFLNSAYTTRANNFMQSNSDSALYYLRKSSAIFKNPITYSYLAGYFIDKNIFLDSSKFYLKKAELLYNLQTKVNHYRLSVLYYHYACLYIKEGDNSKAINLLEKALTYSSYGKNRQHLINIYNLLAHAYRKAGNFSKEKKILEEYKKFNEFYRDAQAKSVGITIQNMEDELSIEQSKRNKKLLIIYSLSFLLIFISLFFYLKKTLTSFYVNNDGIIKDQESPDEKIKSVITLDDLYESAKSRDPNFYNKFQNFYPDFFKNISEVNSEIQRNEIHLLTYIYLNFETKEIAEILFLSPKTIQNRKHNIRKKLNIKSSDDIYIWLKSFYQ